MPHVAKRFKPNQAPPNQFENGWVTYGMIDHKFILAVGKCPDSSLKSFWDRCVSTVLQRITCNEARIMLDAFTRRFSANGRRVMLVRVQVFESVLVDGKPAVIDIGAAECDVEFGLLELLRAERDDQVNGFKHGSVSYLINEKVRAGAFKIIQSLSDKLKSGVMRV